MKKLTKVPDFFLREIEVRDVETINSWRGSRERNLGLGTGFRYVGRDTDERWFQAYLAGRDRALRLGICVTETKRLIGVSYLLRIDWINRDAEFAIWIAEIDFRRKHAGEVATQSTLQHAFYDLNLNRVHLYVLFENKSARSLYHKIGFVEEGCLKQAVYRDGNYHDVVVMGILKSEYAAAGCGITGGEEGSK